MIYEWYKQVPEDSDNETENDLNEVNGDEENKETLPSEQNASEDEIDFDCDDSGSFQNKPIYRKQLTRKRLVHSIDSSPDECSFEPIVYVNRNGNFKTFICYLGLKTKNNTKKISWDSEISSVTGRQGTCDTIHRPIRYLLPNTKALNIETFDDTFHLFFDDEIMDMIVHNINDEIRETLSRLRNNYRASINSYMKTLIWKKLIISR